MSYVPAVQEYRRSSPRPGSDHRSRTGVCHGGNDGSVAIASPPKETRVFDGKRYVLETAITADVALIHARLGDTHGNLVFHKTAMNFNPLAAMAGRLTIAQVERLVEPGDIGPAQVHLPGIFVQRIVETGLQHTAIEKRTTREMARART
jgi:3-oxoacid CoA-transferase subunit A